MNAPYRAMFVEALRMSDGAGHCPWCHAHVRFNASARIAECRACGAMFATTIALTIQIPAAEPAPAPEAAPRTRGVIESVPGVLALLGVLSVELLIVAALFISLAR